MNRDKLRLLTLFGLSFYLLSLMAPAMISWADIEVPEALEEMIIPEQKEGYDQLNEAQKKAMVDWERKSNSYNGDIFSGGSEDTDNGNAIDLDSFGNAIIVGTMQGTTTFGSITLPSSSSFYQNIFVAKLNYNGTWEWAVQAGRWYIDYAYGVVIDSNGDAYVTGSYTIGLNLHYNHNYNAGSSDIFVAKISSSGNWLWQARAGGSGSDYGYRIDIDSSGDLIVGGKFESTATFGSISVTSSGSADVFVAKLNSSGGWLWVNTIGGSSNDYLRGIELDNYNGDIIVSGHFASSTLNFSANNSVHSIQNTGGYDIFVSKFSNNGDLIWKIKADSSADDFAGGVVVDSNSQVYLCGYFKSNISIGNTVLTSKGGFDIFVAKVSNSGSWLWARSAGGPEDDKAYNLVTGTDGSVYVTGSFNENSTFGGNILSSNGGIDIYLAKLDSTGTWLASTSLGGTLQDTGRGIAVDTNGHVHVVGDYQDVIDFGNSNQTSNGGTDVFVISNFNMSKLGLVPSSLNAMVTVGGPSGDYANGIALGLAGTAYVIGSFKENATFGSTTLASSGGTDIFVAGLSESGSWMWALGAGGPLDDHGYAISLSPQYYDDHLIRGQMYITGTFQSSRTYVVGDNDVDDAACFPTSYCSKRKWSNGGSDIFMLQSSYVWNSETGVSSGPNFQYLLTWGGPSDDVPLDISADPSHDPEDHPPAIITGHFSDYMPYGWCDEDAENYINLSSTGQEDIFIGKFWKYSSWSPSGRRCEWLVKAGGNGDDQGRSAAVDSNGNVYVTGSFESTASFGSYSKSSDGSSDVFVAKLNSTGSWEWVVSAGGTSRDYGNGIVINSDDEVYVTGTFYEITATFGSEILVSNGYDDIFMAKLNSTGSWLWAIEAGGTGIDSSKGIVVDSNGDAFITGSVKKSGNFGTSSVDCATSVYCYTEIFLAKSSSDGSWLWATGAGGTSWDSGTGIAISSNDDVVITGTFLNGVSFGNIYHNSQTSTDQDIFVANLLLDSDSDSYFDYLDEFIFEPTQHLDSDNDGFGDNTSGVTGDSCPSTYGDSWQDRWGCPDMDGDGQSDLFDAYMQIPTQWNDTDGDGRGDNWDGVNVNRNGSINGIGEYWPNAYLPDPSPLDYDNDGFEDYNLQSSGATGPYDDCPLIYGTSTEDSSGCIDSDGDGWSDTLDSHSGDGTQHSDQDNDGYGDNATGNQPDACPTVYGESWMDVYGCVDADGDGVSSQTDYDDDDGDEWRDSDDDGHGDNVDECTYVWGNIISGPDRGCPDIDGDGWADRSDDLPNEPTQHQDTDGDGFGDNQSGLTPDSCVSTSGTSTRAVSSAGANETRYGCPDTDSDGYADLSDPCPFQFGNSWVDRMACPDGDQDGISDANDPYPNDPSGTLNDWDGDGVNDGEDDFPADSTQWSDADSDGHGDNLNGTEPDVFINDPTQWSDLDGDGFGDDSNEGATTPDACINEFGNSTDVNTGYGCPDIDGDGVGDRWDAFEFDASQQSDSDSDGFGDNINGSQPDSCPNTYGTSGIDRFGCPDTDSDGTSDLNDVCPTLYGLSTGEKGGCPGNDVDGDGVADMWDELPLDSEQWKDSDGDGYGENMSGSEPDACPNDAGTSWLGGFGCPDADRDGWGDVNDAFATDSSQWNDSDGDGYGDNAEGREPDTCPDSAGDSSEGDVFGCPDSDGDGWANIEDRFPESNTTWSDADGDGFADQGDDDCPNLFGISSISMVGCPDLDGDGLPDILDPDIDGDGLFNTWEYQTDNDPFDATDYPDDTDGDGTPDKYDDDDDGDGFPDSVEKERGTDPKDPEDNPMNQYGDNSGIFFVPGEGFQSGYDAEGYELSVSALVNLLTSEFLLPLLLLPASLLLLLRKRGRFKKMRKRLKSVDSVDELGGAEEAIDRLIMKSRVKVVHGILLRNLYERRRDQLGEGGPKPTLQSRNEQMQSEQSTEWGAPPQHSDDFGDDSHIGGGGRY